MQGEQCVARLTTALLVDLDNTLMDRDAALRSFLDAHVSCADERQRLISSDGGGHRSRPLFYKELADALQCSVRSAQNLFARDLPSFCSLKPEAEGLLERFVGRLVIVTNGTGAMQRHKLEQCGLAGKVEVVISEECGFRKPRPEIFHTALQRASCSAAEALMVGDHPTQDVAGAIAVGIPAVFLRTRWFDCPPGIRAIDSLAELQ